jgi:hypothetical protein
LSSLRKNFFAAYLVPAALDQDIEHAPVLVHGSPQVVLDAIDPNEHFIQVPFVARAWPTTAQRIRVGLAELPGPPRDRLVRDDHAALGQQLFNIAVAEGEAEV